MESFTPRKIQEVGQHIINETHKQNELSEKTVFLLQAFLDRLLTKLYEEVTSPPPDRDKSDKEGAE